MVNGTMLKKIVVFFKGRKIAVVAAAISIIAAIVWIITTKSASLSVIIPQGNWVSESDNLFFPIYNFDDMVFPFQKLFQNIIFLHLPDFFSFFKAIIVLSPVFLAMAAGMAHSTYAGIFSASFVFILLQFDFPANRNLEQLVISSCALAGLASFFCFKERPAIRYTILSLSLAALSQSKGVCFPIVFLFVLFECLCRKSEKKTVWPAFLILIPFLVAGTVWNIVAATENPSSSVFFTESGGRLIPNLIAGAYGLVGTTEGQTAQAVGTSGIFESFKSAIAMIFTHPATYLGSIFERFLFLARESWYVSPLVIIWAASFAILRRRQVLIVPLCAAYFFVVYILMPIEQRYFVPAWILMCVSSAMALSEVLSSKDTYSLPKYVAPSIIAIFFSPHLIVWIASIALLTTFPMRRRSFDIDKALAVFPENRYMLESPLRKSYPDLWDFKGRAEIFKKYVNDELQMYKLRWFEYFMNTQNNQENNEQNNADENILGQNVLPEYNIDNTKKAISWSDMLLESIRYYKKSDYTNADRLAGAAALSCMLSSGYIRTNRGADNSYTAQEKDYADKLALTAANDCSINFDNMFFSIPPWEHQLKETMMERGFGKYLTAQGMSDLYNEKNSDDCDECCVPDGFLKTPSNCGFGKRKLIGAYECFDEYVCKGHNWCRGQENATEQEQNFCTRMGNKITKNDIVLAKKYPVLKESISYKLTEKANYTAALAYTHDKDRKNATLWLLRAMQMNPDIIHDRNFEEMNDFILGRKKSK